MIGHDIGDESNIDLRPVAQFSYDMKSRMADADSRLKDFAETNGVNLDPPPKINTV